VAANTGSQLNLSKYYDNRILRSNVTIEWVRLCSSSHLVYFARILNSWLEVWLELISRKDRFGRTRNRSNPQFVKYYNFECQKIVYLRIKILIWQEKELRGVYDSKLLHVVHKFRWFSLIGTHDYNNFWASNVQFCRISPELTNWRHTRRKQWQIQNAN